MQLSVCSPPPPSRPRCRIPILTDWSRYLKSNYHVTSIPRARFGKLRRWNFRPGVACEGGQQWTPGSIYT